MHLDEINKIAIPVIKSFPYTKGNLFFNEEKLWLESISVDYSECSEFQKIRQYKPKPQNLICSAGYISIDHEEYDIYIIYQYGEKEGEGQIYFLTLILEDTYTYDFESKIWHRWTE